MLKLRVARWFVNLATWLNGRDYYHSGRVAFWLARRFYTPPAWQDYADVYTPPKKEELAEKLSHAGGGVVFHPPPESNDPSEGGE